MTKKQALHLQKDWGSHLVPNDFTETLYVSIKGIGNKIFKNCCYHEQGNYIFIWTKDDSYLINKKELGDFVAISNFNSSIMSVRKNKRVTK